MIEMCRFKQLKRKYCNKEFYPLTIFNVLYKLFFLFKLVLVFSGSLLILLVLRDQIVHIGFGFSEFHLVHTFSGVPMQESLSSEHSSELFSNTLEHLLDGSGVSDESDR